MVSPRLNEQEQQFLQNGGEFRTCKASELFKIKANPQLDKENFVFSCNSNYPYFTRTVANNGILGYVDYLDEEHKICGNSIAVGMLGMKFFYMSHDFYAGQFTKTAFPLFNGFNEKVALWFIAWFNKSSKRFQSVLVRNFEKEFNDTKIIVPYINGEVAVKYIEERVRELEEVRVRELEEERICELEAYLDVAGFKDCTLSVEERFALNQIDTIEFKEKKIGEADGVFDIATGRDIIIGKTSAGNIPLISHQHDNNGISKRISAISDRRIFNCNKTIPLADRGVFLATTQCEDFHIGTRVKALTFKDGEKSENIRLFFVAAINKLQIKFTEYLTNATDSLPHLTILLPVKNNDIDYEFMETYIRAIKKECIARLKAEINREQEVYRKVID